MSTYMPDEFPDCKTSLFVATPRVPVAKSTGRVEFKESTPYFAHNDLGNGTSIKLQMNRDGHVFFEQWVTITWLDWNEFEYESSL